VKSAKFMIRSPDLNVVTFSLLHFSFFVSDEKAIFKILPFSLITLMKNCIDNILAKIKNVKSAKFAICSSDLNVVAFRFFHFSFFVSDEQAMFKILPFSLIALMKKK